jgi:phosphohistidine swiveling domain-containing protein
MTQKDIIKISDLPGETKFSFGEKGLRLQELKHLGFNVPDGILLSVEFLQRLIKSTGMWPDIKKVTHNESEGDRYLDTLVLDLLKTQTPDREFKDILDQALGSTETHAPSIFYAVRSAALGEDDSQTSFAGQYSTVLNVRYQDIWAAVFECYASWWTDRSVSYRRINNRFFSEPQISIIIQHQLNPSFSGVLFTRHPVKASNMTVIEAIAGIGEELVSGRAMPTRWEINPLTKDIVSFEPVPTESASEIKKEHLDSLVETGQKAEKAFGQGLDIEWCIENNTLYLVQVRPISSPKQQVSVRDSTENIYSRSIVEDLWTDRMTEMTASIIFDELSDLYTFKEPLIKLKLDDLAEIRAIRVINGYGYLSCQSVSGLLKLLPDSLRFREIKNVFPPSIREKSLQIPFQISKVLRLLHRVPLLFSDLSMLPFLTVPVLKRHMRNIERQLNSVDEESYKNRDSEFYVEELERLLLLLSSLQIRNQWGYGNATVFTWLLIHLATKFADKSESWVLNQITDIPNNVTLHIQSRLIEISRACDKELIRKVFSHENTDEGWMILQKQYRDHRATKMLNGFIKQYGFRSANRDFIHPRWEEKPGLVLDLVKVLLKSLTDENKDDGSRKIGQRSGSFLRNIMTAPILYILVRMTKSFLALREDLRFALDRVFYRIRKLLLAINSSGILNDLQQIENGIFFLKLNELRSVLMNKEDLRHILPRVENRMNRYFEDQNLSPPYYVMHDGQDTVALTQSETGTNTFECTAASPGVAEGKARIIRDHRDFNKLQKGEILIAYNTDPGWTPLFITAAGVAVEMGGILNHCAIVAREYGIPAVVGLEGITRKIKDGQFVRVDGINGTLSILE